MACACDVQHPPKLVVVTGGPGAGKTALLDIVQAQLCRHVTVLPEAASILWRGGFPRRESLGARRAAQRAIVRLQLELQRMAIEEGTSCLIVCDRGTLDGLAYWPGDPAEYFEELGLDRERELARYDAIIHLRPPTLDHGYRATPVRVETAEVAGEIDQRILAAWDGHPRRFLVPSDRDFLAKLGRGLEQIRREVPACCRS